MTIISKMWFQARGKCQGTLFTNVINEKDKELFIKYIENNDLLSLICL